MSAPWYTFMLAGLVALTGVSFGALALGLLCLASWLSLGVLGTRIGVSRGLIAPWPESLPFYVHGAAIGPLALWAILREPWWGAQ